MKSALSYFLLAANLLMATGNNEWFVDPSKGTGQNPVIAPVAIVNSNDTVVLELGDAVQNNMVVQQNKPLKVYGKASAGKTVTIKADWMPAAISVMAAADSSFMGIVPVGIAKRGDFTQHTIEVSSKEKKIVLVNILIGDTWLCSGQSNMQFSMKEVLDSTKDIAAANYPHIRLMNVGLNFTNEPSIHFKGRWQECSPATVKGFSAVGYYFGRELYETLNIPIGLIFSGIGASAAQAYVPQDILHSDTLLDRVYLQPYLTSPRSKEKMNGGFSFEKVTRPFLLYNAMIYPLTNISVKGICWYQGESNRSERNDFTRLMYAMIKSWRDAFGQGELPFYYVQIAPYEYDKEDPVLADCAYFREAQANISRLNNTSMVTTMDVGEVKNLHPKNKKPIGIRLAKTALNRAYGMIDTIYQGPLYAYAEYKKGAAVIHFVPQSVASGLTTNDGKSPAFFFMAGKDQRFYPATATITGHTITLSSPAVKEPVAVRYAFTNYAVTNFQNGSGIAAYPFRTDDWPELPVKNPR